MPDDVIFEIFRMPDTEEDLYARYPFLIKYRSELELNYRALSRRKEILSEKVLIEKFFPSQNVTLSHNENGMPLLSNGKNISISHTRNYIAMMVSGTHGVALDIEHISDRVKKVGRMYLRNDEPFSEIKEMLVAWCVKETMYKLFSAEKLTFEDIRLQSFCLSSQGTVTAENLKTNKTVVLNYNITDDYVLTMTSVPAR